MGCVTLNFALDLAINKWGGHLPDWAIVTLLILPLIPFGVWAFLHERNVLSREWVFSKFHSHPISILVIACIFLWIVCNQTSRIVARFQSSPISNSEKLLEGKPPKASLAPSQKSPSLASEPLALRTIKPTPQSPKKLKPVATSQAPAPNPPVSQAGNDNQQVVQTMTNSPGGMQAGRDLTVFGPIPTPSRTLNPDDVNRAVALLKQAKNGPRITFITNPTNAPERGEISNFTYQLENVFSKGGWAVVRERNVQWGSFIGAVDGSSWSGEGIGCSSPSNPTPESQLAVKALSILHYPCTHPSILNETDTPAGWVGPKFALYVTVGKRIDSEQ
jgi:hypothetical protein